MMKPKKKLKIFIFSILSLACFLFYFGENIKDSIKLSLNDNNVIKYKFFKDLIKVFGDPRYIMNDYNVNFLPKTQFINFKSFKFKINQDAQDSHFIEIIDKNLIVISSNLKTYIKEIKSINLEKKEIQFKKIDNNLENLSFIDILDSKFYKGKLYISFKKNIGSDCKTVGIASARFDLNFLEFEELFSIDECAKDCRRSYRYL